MVLEDTDNKRKFRALLKSYREKSGLSHEELAKKTNIRQGYLEDIESGKRQPPSRNIVVRLIRFFQEQLDLDYEDQVKFLELPGYGFVAGEIDPEGQEVDTSLLNKQVDGLEEGDLKYLSILLNAVKEELSKET